MRNWLRLALLGSCSLGLVGANAGGAEYSIWAYHSLPPKDATYQYDSKFHQRSVSKQGWLMARHAGTRIRVDRVRGRWIAWAGKQTVPGCDSGPFMWALSPSGSYYACADGYYPSVTLRVFRMRDKRLVSERRLPEGVIEDRDALAFLDDDRLAFTVVDDTCGRDPVSRKPLSIAEVASSGAGVPKTIMRCASGLIAGNARVAYLRSNAGEYSLDGKSWTSQHIYGLDQDDSALTEDSPLVKAFKSDHPDLSIIVIGVSLASASS